MEDLAGEGPGGQDRVVAELLGVAIGGAMLQLAVDLVDGRIDVDDQAFALAWTRPERPDRTERFADHPLELADVAEGEGAQESPERRRCHHPVLEHLCARSGTQHVGVVDVAGPSHHGVDERQDLAARPEPADASGQLDRGVTELLEPETLGQGGDQHQPGVGHQVGLIKGHRDAVDSRDTGFTESASLVGENYGVKYRNSPSIGGIFRGVRPADRVPWQEVCHDIANRQADDSQPVRVRSRETPGSLVVKSPAWGEIPASKRGGATERSAARAKPEQASTK